MNADKKTASRFDKRGPVDQEIIDLFHKLADCSLTEREDYYVRHHVAAERRAEVEALLRFDKTTNQWLPDMWLSWRGRHWKRRGLPR